MKQRLAAYTAEVFFPEREKFTAPLLLLPGLWTGSWIWQEVAWGLSQRGWACWALDLYEQPAAHRRGDISLDDHLTTITTATAAFDCPPIVVGFDLGSLLALLAAPRMQPRALVCISPLLPCHWQADLRPALPLVRLAALPALLWNRSHPPPSCRLARDFLFHTLPAGLHNQLYTQLEPDSGSVVRTLARGQTDFPATPLPCPSLVVWGQEDRMVSASTVRWLADNLQATGLSYPDQGHWLLAGPQAATLVADIHRWLIRSLGEALLLPPEEDE